MTNQFLLRLPVPEDCAGWSAYRGPVLRLVRNKRALIGVPGAGVAPCAQQRRAYRCTGDCAALRAQAEAEGTSMQEVAQRAIRDATSRRAQIMAWVAAVKKDHADAVAELADR